MARMKVTLGADPEFEVFDSRDYFVNASNFFSGMNDRIGCDGASHTGEIRPNPFRSPEDLFKDIRKIIRKELPQYLTHNEKIFAGSGREVPTGGHIHFGGLGHRPDGLLLTNLDYWISKPLNRISDKRHRRRYGYGRMKSWREQPHGFEYRTPLSWIVTPKICKGVLALAYILTRAKKEITTKKELLSISRKREKRVLKEFWEEISGFAKNKKKLEYVEIFQAWGKKKVAPQRMAKYNIATNWNIFDGNMENVFINIGILNCYRNFNFRGAREFNLYGREYTLYVPRTVYNTLLIHWLGKTRIVPWELNTIGISMKLREKPKYAASRIRGLIKLINREIKNGRI